MSIRQKLFCFIEREQEFDGIRQGRLAIELRFVTGDAKELATGIFRIAT